MEEGGGGGGEGGGDRRTSRDGFSVRPIWRLNGCLRDCLRVIVILAFAGTTNDRTAVSPAEEEEEEEAFVLLDVTCL